MHKITIPDKKLIVFYSNKCGSTTLKHLLLRYALGLDDVAMKEVNVHWDFTKLLPGSFQPEAFFDGTFRCLVVTRDPYERFISAFINKYPLDDDPTFREACQNLSALVHDDHFAPQSVGVGWRTLRDYQKMGGEDITFFDVSELQELNLLLASLYPEYTHSDRLHCPHGNERKDSEREDSEREDSEKEGHVGIGNLDTRRSQLEGVECDKSTFKGDEGLARAIYEFYKKDYERLGYAKPTLDPLGRQPTSFSRAPRTKFLEPAPEAFGAEVKGELLHWTKPDRQSTLGTETPFYSQDKEELAIREFFQDQRGGFFVDVGAGHPIRHSNTYYLEQHLGWSGMGVDALGDYEPIYREFRPRTRFHNFIVTDHTGPAEGFYWVPAAPGLSSTLPDRPWRGQVLRSRGVEVPTTTLDDLFAAQGVDSIDFLSIDLEESPLEALAGLTLSRIRPRLICIEVDAPTSPQYRAIFEHFKQNGYRPIPRYATKSNAFFCP